DAGLLFVLARLLRILSLGHARLPAQTAQRRRAWRDGTIRLSARSKRAEGAGGRKKASPASQTCDPPQGKSRKPEMAAPRDFESLVAIMNRLREPGGCPWDREQNYATLRGYLVEECYEVVDALDRVDLPALREELGDLLFQIVFLSRLAQEDQAFDAGDVVAGIAAKMIRRHPHVFGDAEARDSAEVLVRW